MPTIHGIYPILDLATLASLPSGPPPVEAARLLQRLGIAQVQIRGKGAGAPLHRFARAWCQALRQNAPAIRIILNDRVDVALALGADGVHLGQEDLPATAARQLLGPGALIGVSTHDPAEIDGAVAAGADYVGFGPLFPTRSKSDTQPLQGLAGLTAACAHSPLPVAAIGGIGLAELPGVARAGAAAAAMIGGLWLGDWRANLEAAVSRWPASHAP